MIVTQLITRSLGMVLCAIALAMALPVVVDLADGNRDWQVFAASSLFSFFIGFLLTVTAGPPDPSRFNIRTGFVLTTVVWVMATAFAAIPFVGVGLTFTDAYFEAMSGLTTTGSTVLVQLDVLPRGVLLWRSELQAVGGLGIIVTALLMLPFLQIGGMQLFATESSERSDKVFPRSAETVTAIALIYGSLIVACAAAYAALGMTAFDAICHALTTVSTGGFSTHDESFGFFRSSALQWVCIVFMVLGSVPFLLIYRGLLGKPFEILRDHQLRSFLWVSLAATLAMVVALTATTGSVSLDVLRRAAFNAVSLLTTTGFASEDYSMWGALAVGVAFLLTFIGGCSGSTAGGVKIYRLDIAWLIAKSHLITLASPNRVTPLVYNRRKLDGDVVSSVATFMFVYLFTALLFTLVLAGAGLDFITAVSSSAQALASVGPGLGEIVGPAGNYSSLPDIGKWTLSFEMLLGRLELLTVLVLFEPEFWRT